MLQPAALLCSALLFCSCASYPINTASGRPEVTLNATLPQAKRSAIVTMAAHGYTLTNEGANLMTFQSQMTTGDGMVFLMAVGNSNYSLPIWTAQLTFFQDGRQTKILGNIQGSSTSPFGQTKSIDATRGRAGQNLQGILESLQSSYR